MTTLSELTDKFWDTLQRRLALDRESKKLKAEEDMLEQLIINELRAQKLEWAEGQSAILGLQQQEVPKVTDWKSYWEFVLQEEDLALVERRPGKSAIKERWEAGVQVPGVEKSTVYSLTRSEVKEA